MIIDLILNLFYYSKLYGFKMKNNFNWIQVIVASFCHVNGLYTVRVEQILFIGYLTINVEALTTIVKPQT